MARTSKNPKKFIVSCRVNSEEMEVLKALAEDTGINLSDLLRHGLTLVGKHRNLGTRARAGR